MAGRIFWRVVRITPWLFAWQAGLMTTCWWWNIGVSGATIAVGGMIVGGIASLALESRDE